MEQTLPLEQLTLRLFAVERETAQLRRDINQLHLPLALPQERTNIVRFADQQMITAAIDQLFAKLGIPDEPVNIAELQERMRDSGLAPNELSRGIIEMRDE